MDSSSNGLMEWGKPAVVIPNGDGKSSFQFAILRYRILILIYPHIDPAELPDGAPFDITGDPKCADLNEKEKEVCKLLRLLPHHYLLIKVYFVNIDIMRRPTLINIVF